MEKTLALQLVSSLDDEKNLIKVLRKSGSDPDVCLAVLAKIDIQEWSSRSIINLVMDHQYNVDVAQPFFQYLNLKEISLDGALKLLEQTNYNYVLFNKVRDHYDFTALDPVRRQEIMTEFFCRVEDPEIRSWAAGYLSLSTKDDEQIVRLLTLSNYSISACQVLAPYLTGASAVKEMLRENYGVTYNDSIWELCSDRLGLANKNEKQLITLLEEFDYEPELCRRIIVFPQIRKKIFQIISGSRNNLGVIKACIPFLESDRDILSLRPLSGFHPKVSLEVLAHLRSEEVILQVLSGNRHNAEAIESGLKRLNLQEKSAADILAILKLLDFNQAACHTCLPYLKMELEDDEQLIGMLEFAKFHITFTQILLSAKEWGTYTETDMMEFIKKCHWNEQVCCFFAPSIKEEENIKSFLNHFADQFSGRVLHWPMKFDLFFSRMKEADIIEILMSVSFCPSVSQYGLKYLTTEQAIFAVMEGSEFNEEICKLSASRLELIK